MTIPLVSPAERVRENVHATLTTYLGSEIALINIESGGDVVIPALSVQIERFLQVEAGRETVFEVEITGVQMSVVGATFETSFGRVTSSVLVEVSCVVCRDDTWSDKQFVTVVDRMGAAISRVMVMRYRQLGDTTHVLETVSDGFARHQVDQETDPSGQELRRVVVPLKVRLQERLS